MVKAIYLSREQEAIFKEVKVLSDRFEADSTLFQSQTAIASAKALIDKAVAAGLDQGAYALLQICISSHETEQDLPEHLRSWKPRS